MATVTLPARCAVAVICGDHLVSQVYPAAVPVEVFFDNIVELLNEDLKRRGVAGLDPGGAYELQRANGSRLDITRTLDDLGIEDGMTLILAPAEDGQPFEPQCESLATGLAVTGRKLFAPVTAETAALTATAILGMAAFTILGMAVFARTLVDSVLPGLFTGLVGLLVAAGGFALRRWWPTRHDLMTAFVWLAVPLLSGGLTLGAPGRLGSAHLFIAALTAAGLTGFAVIVTGRHVMLASAVITLSALCGLTAGIRMLTDTSAQRLGMVGLTALLVLLTISPTIAMWTARIRPPDFGSITGRDLFHRRDGLPFDVVSPVDESADEETEQDTAPRGALIAEMAYRANAVLTGICVASAVALPAAVWTTVTPSGPHHYATAVLALLFVIIFISRARAFADRRQAVALVCGAAAGFCAGVGCYMVRTPGNAVTALIIGGLVLLVFGFAALIAAWVVPATRFTPIVRMLTEWLELVAVVAALPLAAWIGGLFTWIRMR